MALQDWLGATIGGKGSKYDVGDAIGSAIDVYDAWQGREGAQDALKTIEKGYDKGIGYLQDTAQESKDIFGDIYETTRGDIAPYQGAGTTALDQYMGLMTDPSTIMDDPAAQFRYQQGLAATKRDLEAAGYADPMGSSSRLAGITEYGQGFASQELDRALERRLPIIKGGLSSAGLGAEAGSTYAQGVARTNAYLGPAIAQMYKGRADARSSKDLIDAMFMSSALGEGVDAISAISGDPNLMDLIMQAVGGKATSDGVPLMDLIKDTIGGDALGQITDWLGFGGGGAGAGSLGLGFADIPAADALGTALGAVDYGSLFTGGGGTGWQALGGKEAANLLKDLGFEVGSTSIGGELGAGVDWANLFSMDPTKVTGSLFGEAGAAGTSLPGFGGATGAEALTPGGTGMEALFGGGQGSLESLGATAGGEAGLAATPTFGSWATTALGVPLAIYAGLELLSSKDEAVGSDLAKNLMKKEDPYASALEYLGGGTLGNLTMSERQAIDPDSAQTQREHTSSVIAAMVENDSLESLQQRDDFSQIKRIVEQGFWRGDLSREKAGGGSYADAMMVLYPELSGSKKLLNNYLEAVELGWDEKIKSRGDKIRALIS